MRTPKLAARILPVLAALLAPACDAPARVASAPVADARAAELFALHCAACHGERGAGDGPTVTWLFPPPRDFTQGRFRIVSARHSGPSREDLLSVLRRGLPGSAMPSFAWMARADLERLAEHVRGLAVEGLAERAVAKAARAGETLPRADARREAELALAPGEPVVVPAELPVDAALLARGESVYLERCAACHGADGRAEDDAPQWTDEGDFGWARDFTAGVLKGGATRADLARRVLCGMPGTTMPAHAFADEHDLAALLAHLGTLIPRDADRRLVQERRTLVAARAADWVAPATRVVLAPMLWAPGRVLELHVRARHDGARLAVQLAWDDPERDVGEAALGAAVDGAALAFSPAPEPPVMGMGARGHALELWHWRANLWTDRAGVLDLLEHPPHVLDDPRFAGERADVVPRYLPARRADAATDELALLRAEGGVPLALDGFELTADARWADGRWRVEFAGPLDPAWLGAGRVQLAFAIWNAAPPGSLASKSVTIWHELELAP